MGVMLLLAAAFQEDTNPSSAGGGIIAAILGVGGLFGLVLALAVIAGLWKVFEKAGKPGWASLIPIYNLIVLLEIVGKPLWWIVFFLCVPIGWILVPLELAKVFGKDIAFALGLIFLGFIFVPILGFGDARYVRPAAPPAQG
jgi:hypothetical protein